MIAGRVRTLMMLGLALALLAGCAQTGGTHTALTPLLRTELYFGLSRPDGKTVSEAEWKDFLDSHVTPLFREGLTVLDASGQYQDKAGKVISERTKIVILVHADAPDREAALLDIISAYKRAFQQESVLRVTNPVGAGF